MKACSTCDRTLPVDMFVRDARNKSGLSARCKRCHRLACVDWQSRNPGRQEAASKAWREANVERERETRQARRLKNGSARNHAVVRERTTGWTQEEYEAARVSQGFRCKMCGRHEDSLKRALHADHHHATGSIRALLCPACNNRIEPVLTRYLTDPDFRVAWDHYLAAIPSGV